MRMALTRRASLRPCVGPRFILRLGLASAATAIAALCLLHHVHQSEALRLEAESPATHRSHWNDGSDPNSALNAALHDDGNGEGEGDDDGAQSTSSSTTDSLSGDHWHLPAGEELLEGATGMMAQAVTSLSPSRPLRRLRAIQRQPAGTLDKSDRLSSQAGSNGGRSSSIQRANLALTPPMG